MILFIVAVSNPSSLSLSLSMIDFTQLYKSTVKLILTNTNSTGIVKKNEDEQKEIVNKNDDENMDTIFQPHKLCCG